MELVPCSAPVCCWKLAKSERLMAMARPAERLSGAALAGRTALLRTSPSDREHVTVSGELNGVGHGSSLVALVASGVLEGGVRACALG